MEILYKVNVYRVFSYEKATGADTEGLQGVRQCPKKLGPYEHFVSRHLLISKFYDIFQIRQEL